MALRVAGTIICSTLAALSLGTAQTVPPATPSIQSIFPRGGQQGTELRIEIGGRDLAGASEVRVSGGGVSCQVLEASEKKVTALVKIAAGADVGRRDLRVFTPHGSFVQGFEVGALPEAVEKEPNNSWSDAPMTQTPLVINGRITAGDYDHFRFSVKAGQTLIFDLNSTRTGTRFDGVLSLLDDKGRQLTEQDDYYFDKDPHLVYRFTEAGEYVLRAWGFRESGSAAAEYRLLIGEVPDLQHVFPAGGRRGEMVEFVLAGRNLAEVEDFQLDQTPLKAEFLEKRADRLKFRIRIPPDFAPGYYPLRVRVRNTDMPNPLVLAVSDTPEISFFSDVLAEPLPLRLPVIVNGRLARPRQRDLFWLDVNAGEQITFQGDGMALGNFLDPAITIYDNRDKVVAYMDETAPNGFDKAPPNLDFHLVHRFEQEGRYRVEMRDAGLRGRDDLIYRLHVSRSDPDFQVSVLAPQVTALQGGTSTFSVQVRRLGGWNTPVQIWVENLPPGVSSQAVTAEPVNTRFRGTFGEDFFFDGTNVEVPLKVQEGTTPGAYSLQVKARGIINNKTVDRTAVVFHHWYQTGFLRGPTQEQQFLMTVSKPAKNKGQDQISDSTSK